MNLEIRPAGWDLALPSAITDTQVGPTGLSWAPAGVSSHLNSPTGLEPLVPRVAAAARGEVCRCYRAVWGPLTHGAFRTLVPVRDTLACLTYGTREGQRLGFSEHRGHG